ncbi:cache domain-containing protein [Noviherbaspirillum sp. CPCC 100848]|uniref:Cache domain-containing protein n=1 Tax=Noviherbaspirillum album TaxID=3080276 RepID=A0ABU6JFN9_9BURK|nr:cache domain-containing protein [Noviherbaspirillum sp. CPCC 100848]MEC4722095.1 cache domain-containing protein [Noviherbaspirillum sp. CPCC 100848]
MKIKYAALAFAAFAISTHAFADDAADATAIVKKAVAYIKDNGKDKAFAEFNNPTGAFTKGELYVFVSDMQGKMLSHGANSKLIGKNLIELKDADGKLFVKDYTDLAKTKGSGWVDYKWVNPNSKAIDKKSTYVEKADDVIVGAGIYKK